MSSNVQFHLEAYGKTSFFPNAQDFNFFQNYLSSLSITLFTTHIKQTSNCLFQNPAFFHSSSKAWLNISEYIEGKAFFCLCFFSSIDNLTIPSKQPGKPPLRRVPEVFDCWFESGSMPYAQLHYPFENKESFDSRFPADFIAEGIDQTRGWYVWKL